MAGREMDLCKKLAGFYLFFFIVSMIQKYALVATLMAAYEFIVLIVSAKCEA